MDERSFDRLIILADESANWVVGGLRQLDRLALAGNDFAEAAGRKIEIIVWWKPEITPNERWQPTNRRIANATISFGDENSLKTGDCVVLSTRLLVTRRGLPEFLSDMKVDCVAPDDGGMRAWQALQESWEQACHQLGAATSGRNWRCLRSRHEVGECDRWLLRSTGKSYDGLISRYLNRPISRFVSRFLLRLPITPNQWTFFILIFPLATCVCLSFGTYAGFVAGTFLYHLHSVLDGCDGEIARIKYLDSKSGPGMDALGDLIGLLLFITGLTIGLFNWASGPMRYLFLTEGAFAFVFMLLRLGPHTLELLDRGMDAVLFSEHDDLVRRSGDRYFGRRLVSLVTTLTARDVVHLFFFVLALLRLTPLILHLLFLHSSLTFLLVWKGRIMRRAAQTGSVP